MTDEEPDQRTEKQKAWAEMKANDPRRKKAAAKRRTREANKIMDSVLTSMPAIMRARR